MSANWKQKNWDMRRYRARQNRMRNYIEENGHNETGDAEAVKEWLSKNKVAVGPPYKHKADEYE